MKGIRLTVTALMLMSGAALAFASVPGSVSKTKAEAFPPPETAMRVRSSDDPDFAGLLRQQVSLMREQTNLQKELIALQHALLAQGRQLHEGCHVEEAQSKLRVNEKKEKTDE